MNDLFGMQGKAALVIGGGQGIGEANACLLAEVGCDVAIADLDGDRARAVAQKVQSVGRRAAIAIGDVLDPTGVQAIVEKAWDDLGRLDVLVCVVGRALFKPAIELTAEDWDLDQSRNLRYAFLAAQAFARRLIETGRPGTIVFTGSVSGLQASTGHAAYGAAKAALYNLVKSLAVEWAPHGIRVNCVAPGGIATPRYPLTPERAASSKAGPVPLKRLGTADEIAKGALFLSSDLSTFVTGQTLSVDGGWSAANLCLHSVIKP